MDWYIEVMQKYAVFRGRARRKEYWVFTLVNIIITIVIGFVLGFFGSFFLGAETGTALSGLGTSVYGLAVFVPNIAVAVRRMHDIGRSGWWILLPLVNLIFLCLGSQPGDNEYGPEP